MTNKKTLSETLNLQTAVIEWRELQMFFAKGKLLILDSDLDLLHIACLIAGDHANELSKLIHRKKIEFASPHWVKKHCQDQTALWAVVVSPYVIAQLKLNDSYQSSLENSSIKPT